MLLPDKITKIRGLTVSIATTLEMSFDAFSSFEMQNYKNTWKKMPVCQYLAAPWRSSSTEYRNTLWPVFRQGLFISSSRNLSDTHSDSVFLWLSWFLENTQVVFYNSGRNVPDQAFITQPYIQ